MGRQGLLEVERIRKYAITAVVGAAILAAGMPLAAQTTPARAGASRTTGAQTSSRTTTPARGASAAPAAARPATPAAPVVKSNPLLPAPIALDGLYQELTLSPKGPGVPPAGFEPLCTAAEWQVYREKFGAEADNLTKLRSSGQMAFAEKLIAAATGTDETLSKGVRRVLLVRAAAIAYRSTGGFPTADKAVTAYLGMMDKKAPAQVGALWSAANAISRTSVTPKPDRIRYDGIAAKANMQLSLLLLQADQVEAAQGMIKQIAYHEGWLKGDAAALAMIAQVRGEVRGTATMMDYLATQYQPAIRNDVTALTMVYLYGRYVKNNLAIVADLPGRVPESHLARLAGSLDAAAAAGGGRGNMMLLFTAAENLRMVAGTVPDGRIRARTLYAAMQLYDAFLASPLTERARVERTLARIAREGVVTDGARKGFTVDVFAAPVAPASGPAREAPGRPSLELPEVRVALGQ